MKKMKNINIDKIVKDLERINKIKKEFYKGKGHYYDEGIKPEYRCRDDEHTNSN